MSQHDIEDHLNFAEMLMKFLQAANAHLTEIGCTDLLEEDVSSLTDIYEVYLAKAKNGHPKSSYPRKYNSE